MAGTSLLALLDDIAAVLDDVAVLTKVAAKKTAGVLGDDLALNAEQVSGVVSNREIPVVWAVAKGSALNKTILVPLALAISALIPWAVVPLLMLGGAFLCYEGFEKVVHKFFHREEEKAEKDAVVAAFEDPEVDMVEFEKDKIKGAIRTDFILSAEIIVIALGTVADEPFMTRLAVLVGISILMNVGVYGLVAGIVKLDDLGMYLARKSSAAAQKTGNAIVTAAPYLMKGLGIAGTVAMFLVGGGILVHGIPGAEKLFHDWAHATGPLEVIVPTLLNGLAGVVAGALILAIVNAGSKVVQKARA